MHFVLTLALLNSCDELGWIEAYRNAGSYPPQCIVPSLRLAVFATPNLGLSGIPARQTLRCFLSVKFFAGICKSAHNSFSAIEKVLLFARGTHLAQAKDLGVCAPRAKILKRYIGGKR